MTDTKTVIPANENTHTVPKVHVRDERILPAIGEDGAELSSWLASVREIMGSKDQDLAGILLSQACESACLLDPSNESQVNAIISTFAEMRPSDPLEAMLIAQMLGCHTHAMKTIHRAVKTSYGEITEKSLRLSDRLMRTFITGMEALEKYRRKGSQSVKVEHVNVNAGGQSIVGSVQGLGGESW